MTFYKQATWQTAQVGNNALSYAERMALWSQWKLYIASFVDWTIDDLSLWENVVFEEVNNGKLLSCRWLASLIKTRFESKTVYISDNHNHALAFWYEWFIHGLIPKWVTLLHVDQHADMNEPSAHIDMSQESNLDYIAEYVNTQTQIASFIQPAIRSGLITECIQIRSEAKLQEVSSKAKQYMPYILDIDIDFFAEEKEIEDKLALLRSLMPWAMLITIATSPFFIDQKKAIDIVKKLLSS